jgi:hypothetical protein
MNRLLLIPAVCCLVALATLLAVLHGATGGEASATGVAARGGNRETMPSQCARATSDLLDASGDRRLTPEEAKAVLASVADRYVRPWQEWRSAPHRIYSRAAVRPIPSILASVEMPLAASRQSDSFLVASIAVSMGSRSESTPCVVDRITGQVCLYAEGQWLTEDEWLKLAPLPQ